MLHVYTFIPDFDELRTKCTIDMSKIPSCQLADECEQILQHHKHCILFLGFLEPGWMLDSKHEARIRLAIRKFESHIVTFHTESLPLSWKNEIDTLYVRQLKQDGCTKTLDDGCSVQHKFETKD